MSEFLIVLAFLFIAILGCIGVGFLILGIYELLISMIDLLLIEIKSKVNKGDKK